jgi:hypothetical protein
LGRYVDLDLEAPLLELTLAASVIATTAKYGCTHPSHG